jgi:hypothetical protein
MARTEPAATTPNLGFVPSREERILGHRVHAVTKAEAVRAVVDRAIEGIAAPTCA